MDIATYEQVLKSRRRELFARLRRIENDLGDLRDTDSIERAVEAEDDEVLQDMGQAGQGELKAIDAALERIVDGRFGTCVRCGNAISEKRLHAVPHAALCETCIAGPLSD